VDLIADGAAAGIDVLAGTTTDEWGLFVHPTGMAATLDDADIDALARRLSSDGDQARRLVAVYREDLPGLDAADLFSAIQSDWSFGVPVDRLLDGHSGSHTDSARGRTFAYEFGWRPATFDGRVGACHTLEIPFVFDTLDDPWGREIRGEDAPQDLAEDMHAAWVDFIRDGDPGWPVYGPERAVRRFDERGRTPLSDPHAARREAWSGVMT
jgi:para-nitrobenzyl esterase